MILISAILGCVYAIEDDALINTPINKDESFDDNQENWIEVDHMSLLGEEKYIQDEIMRVENILRAKFN